ncbi:MAG TPA: Wzz/FepE/Etk N-terminal domain-containing protein [Usitatibacter sp.]|nr:Wzz/FepE/Etk N-terminal domain-containing protein [Usitatibacter sp.]
MSTYAPIIPARPRDADTFDVVGTVRAISEATRYHWRLILVTCAITVGIAVLYHIVWPPVYQAEALLVAESDADPVRDSFYNNWNTFRKDAGRTEIELLMSGSVLKEVIQREHLTYDEVYHPFLSHLGYLWEKSWPGRAYMKVKSWITGEDDGSNLDPATKDLGRSIIDMRAGLQVLPIGESTAGRVLLKGPSKRVADVLNTLLRVYEQQRGERHQNEARMAFDAISGEVDKAKAELDAASAARVKFLNDHGLVFDLQKETQEVKTLAELETNAMMVREKIAGNEATLRAIESELAQQKPTTTLQSITEANSLRDSARLRRQELQATLIGAQTRYRPDSPEILELQASIKKFDELIASNPETVQRSSAQGPNSIYQQLMLSRNTLTADLAGSRASLASLEASSNRLRDRLSRIPAIQDGLRVHDRNLGLAAEKYQALLGKRAVTQVSMATATTTSPSLRVVDYAVTPYSKSWPRLKILYPAALGIGLLLGLFAAQVKRLAGGRARAGAWGRRRLDAQVYGTVAVPVLAPFALLRAPVDIDHEPAAMGDSRGS